MKAVYALCSSPESAQRAVDGLRAAGIADRRITILSSEPMEEYEFGSRDRSTLMPWIAALGGAMGLASGYFLTSVTQQLWPLETGGMPIVSTWPNLIVMFELAMLGGILSAVLTLLVTAGIPSRLPELYDPEISGGKILIGVADPPDAAEVERMLLASGAGTLKRL